MGDARTQRLKPHCGGISIRACASSQLTPSPPSPVLADLLQSIGTPGKDEGELGDVVRAEVGMRNGFGRVGDAPKRVRQQLALTAWGGGGGGCLGRQKWQNHRLQCQRVWIRQDP